MQIYKAIDPGLLMCVFGVCITTFTRDGEGYIETFSKYYSIEKYGILKANT